MLQFLKGNIPEFPGQKGFSRASLDSRWGRNGSKPAQGVRVGAADTERAEAGEDMISYVPIAFPQHQDALGVWMCSRGAQDPTLRQRMFTAPPGPLRNSVFRQQWISEGKSVLKRPGTGWLRPPGMSWQREKYALLGPTLPPEVPGVSHGHRGWGDLGTAAGGVKGDFPAEGAWEGTQGMETREGNEVLQNKSNCFDKKRKQTLLHSCFSCREMRGVAPLSCPSL